MKPINRKFLKLKKIINSLCLPIVFFRRFHSPLYVKNIMVLDCHLIGDIVMLIPFLESLRAAYPKANITLIAGPWAKEILMRNELLVDEFVDLIAPWVKKGGNLFSGLLNLVRVIFLLRKKRWDLAVEMRGDFRQIFFLWLCGPKIFYGLDLTGGGPLLTHVVDDDGQYAHIMDHHKNIAIAMGIVDKNYQYLPRIYLTDLERKSSLLVAPFIGIHFGASNKLRQFEPADAFALIDLVLKSREDRMVIFETLEYPPMTSIINQYLDHPRITFWRGDLREFIITVSRCLEFYCMDSGPSHISAALGIKTSIFFGPANSNLVAPFGPHVRIIENSGLSCKPCDQYVCHNSIYKKCLVGLPFAVNN